MQEDFSFKMPATIGIQGGKKYYMVDIPMATLKRLVAFDSGNVLDRSQRKVSAPRAQKISNYIQNNPTTYILPALVGVANGNVSFSHSEVSEMVGVVSISMDCEILLFDGQHRATGIIDAVEKQKGAISDTIPVMLFTDMKLQDRKQAFADINGSTVKPSGSLAQTYNTRNPLTIFLLQLCQELECLNGSVDFENNIVPKFSDKLFTMKLLTDASKKVAGIKGDGPLTADQKNHIQLFWQCCDDGLTWSYARSEMDADEYRQKYLASHGVFVIALAIVARQLFKTGGDICNLELAPELQQRENKIWHNRCVDPNTQNMLANAKAQKLTAAKILLLLDIPLPEKLVEIEEKCFGEVPLELRELKDDPIAQLEAKIEIVEPVVEVLPFQPCSAWYHQLVAHIDELAVDRTEYTAEQLDEMSDKIQLVSQETELGLATMLCVVTKAPDLKRLLNLRSLRALTHKYKKSMNI